MTHPAKLQHTGVSGHSQAIVALIAVAALWGFTYPITQNAIRDIPVSWFLVLRFTTAFAVLIAVFWRTILASALLSRHNQRSLALAMIAGLANFGGFAGQTIGLQTTTSSKVAFIIGLSVVMVPLIMLIIQKAPSRRLWLPAFGSVIGLACLMGQTLSLDFVVGDAWALLSAFAFTIQIVIIGLLPKDMNAFVLTTVQVAVCLICTIGWAAIDSPTIPAIEVNTLGPAIFLGVVTTAFALTIQTWAQRRAAANEAALIFCTEPVWGAIAGTLLSAEQFTGLGMFGCLIMLISMIWPQLRCFHLNSFCADS